VAGILTSALGASAPRPAIAWMASEAPGLSDVAPCSQSIITQERCGLDPAMYRAVSPPGRVIHVPKAGVDALKALYRV